MSSQADYCLDLSIFVLEGTLLRNSLEGTHFCQSRCHRPVMSMSGAGLTGQTVPRDEARGQLPRLLQPP